jgi:cation:H+ antiporter
MTDCLTTLGGALALAASSLLFTGAVECLGARLRLSHGAVGSTLAALGTALPEASVAMVALLAGPRSDVGVGVGAILGAPLLLATAAPVVAGVAAWRLRGLRTPLRVDRRAIASDMEFFLPAFLLVGLAAFVPTRAGQRAVAAVLVLAYALHVRRALAGRPAPHGGEEAAPPLLLWARAGPAPGVAVLGQLAVGLAGMLAGAEAFVAGVQSLARALGAGGFALAVLIAPLATELPETMNSVIWLRQGKDTLALGNITGALALQGTLIPALGIAAIPWRLGPAEVLTLAVTLVAALLLYAMQRLRGGWTPAQLVAAGLLYAAYLVWLT